MAAAVNFGDQLVDGHTRFRKLTSVKLSSHSAGLVNAVTISQDGTLMASADDGGGLEIRVFDNSRRRWVLVRKYTRGGQIRTLHWWRGSTSAPWALFLGSNYGLVWRILLNFVDGDMFSKKLDIISRAKVDGYVHCLSVSSEGKLIVASGETIRLYDHPFQTGNDLGSALLFQDVAPIATSDERAELETQYDVRWVPRVRRFHFLQGDAVLLSFFGRIGLHVFSTTNGMQQYSIPLRPGHIVGSSALSPGGDILAVTNLRDGVDWYSVSSMQYLSTSRFNVAPAPARNIIVDLVFVDQLSVAVGHSRGDFIVATFGFPNPVRHEESQDARHNTNESISAMPNIAFGVTESKHLIVRVAMSGTGKSSRRFVLQVRQILASKDRTRILAMLADARSSRKDSEGQTSPERQSTWDAIKNYPISLALVSIWGAANVLIYTGTLLRASTSESAAPTITATETKYSTATVISMAQVTQTATSTYVSTNWQTVTMTPPPTLSACFCTVMLSGVLQQAAIETGLSAGDHDTPSYIDQASLN